MRASQTSASGLLAIAGALAACALLAACGGSSSPGSDSPNASSASRDEALLKFSRCMRQHGIKSFPNPEFSEGKPTLHAHSGPGGIEASPQIMEAAQKACQHYQEAAAPKLTPQERVQREEALQKFATCMREHGIHVEVQIGGAAVAIKIHANAGESGPNPESPAFQEAQETCQKLLPAGGKGRLSRLPRPPGPAKGSGSGSRESHASLAIGGS